ncbi:helix-turn-helix transcriptional regulator [Thalassotalea fusca]
MKISAATVRRLRSERGWSQEQVAIASGLSVRTIQRVEAEGIASMATAVCLAATFEVALVDIQNAPSESAYISFVMNYGWLFLCLVITTIAVINETLRFPDSPLTEAFASINLLLAVVGTLLVVPSVPLIIKERQYAGTLLAVIGTPLFTIFVVGGFIAIARGQFINFPLIAFGVGGAALVIMAIIEINRRATPSQVS